MPKQAKKPRARDDDDEVIPAKKPRLPPGARAALRAPEPTDAELAAALKVLRKYLERKNVARSATDGWTVRLGPRGNVVSYVSAAREVYTSKQKVRCALAPPDADAAPAGPSAAQVWGASRPGAAEQAIAALGDDLVAKVEKRLALPAGPSPASYFLPPAPGEAAARRVLEAASKRAEKARGVSATRLARPLLDGAAGGYGAGFLLRLARSRAAEDLVLWDGDAATADALAAAAAAERAFAASAAAAAAERALAPACFDLVDLAGVAASKAHAFAMCARTKLDIGAPPTTVARFAGFILARCCILEEEARRAAATCLAGLRAAAARKAAAAAPAALPAAAPAVAPLAELPEAIVLLRALADVFAATGAYAFEGAEQALGPLEAAVEGRSLSAWKATRELGDVRTSMST